MKKKINKQTSIKYYTQNMEHIDVHAEKNILILYWQEYILENLLILIKRGNQNEV